jgi:chemotaxis protein methyltransferase CheR
VNNDLKLILNYLNEQRGFDFSGYRTPMVERRFKQVFLSTKCNNYKDYLQYLKANHDEPDNLINALTINVSRFFRDTLVFEYIADRVIPAVIHQKKQKSDSSLRIWSAGCAMGEEPYSIAILIQDFFKKEVKNFQVNIFATDIEKKILQKAKKAVYPLESVEGVKYRLLNKYFTVQEKLFKIIPEIKDLVSFSVYDILDRKTSTPPESIYGDFDLVFCRNVLIYFDSEHQDQIFGKLYRALAKNGYLILGEAEIPLRKYQRYFRKVNECCHIYQKI